LGADGGARGLVFAAPSEGIRRYSETEIKTATLPVTALAHVQAGFGLAAEPPENYEVYIDDVLVY
jgi:hypothetical protein